jgi:putative tryptophan/tyrosine transport system substrate-binding protein
MRRRAFITLLGGAAAWPLAGRAQQAGALRRVVVFTGAGETDPQFRKATAAFVERMHELGWTEGRNLQLDYRWGGGNSDEIRKQATELAALAPDVILVSGTAAVGPLVKATRTVPIVFVVVPDPVGAGYVDSLARPGGNVTGFTNFEYGLSAKWLQLLKEIAPNVTRAAVLRDADLAAGTGQFGAIQAVAASSSVEVSPVNMRDAAEIERGIGAFARSPNGGLIVTQSALALLHRELILALAARHRLPAVYVNRLWAAAGGLSSYGANLIDELRRGADYVDRILKGEKPADLPVQAPVKYELVINLRTAKALGLDVPTTVLARADEVIE